MNFLMGYRIIRLFSLKTLNESMNIQNKVIPVLCSVTTLGNTLFELFVGGILFYAGLFNDNTMQKKRQLDADQVFPALYLQGKATIEKCDVTLFLLLLRNKFCGRIFCLLASSKFKVKNSFRIIAPIHIQKGPYGPKFPKY